MSELSIKLHGPFADDPVTIVDDTGTVVASLEHVIDAIRAYDLIRAASSGP